MNPVFLFATLLSIVLILLWCERQPQFSKLFHYLPTAFWCYFVPVMLSTFGLLPASSPVYTFLTTYVLSACLLLLLLSVNLPAIARLGPTALGAMAVGALGIATGAVIAWGLWAPWLPPGTWKGIGALSASWIGGSANMVAVKEALQAPDSVFAPMVIVDTVVTYSWMAILVSLAPWQDRWDAWVRADRSSLEDVNRRLTNATSIGNESSAPKLSALSFQGAAVFLGAMLVGAVCIVLGRHLPPMGDALNASGWSFLIVTLLGVLASMTPLSQWERFGASRWGYFCLYLLLAAIGAKARLQDILRAPLILAMAATWVGIHALMLAAYGRWRRVPLFFLVTSSQANIGGTASTPLIAGIFQPGLAPLGLLLAISGNVIGTYAGLAIAAACHWIHP
jgi:uncharacterized membrane protein